MLFTRECGSLENPAIVFLHGGGLSSKAWTPQLDTLGNDFYCLAPDLPEQGQSLNVQPFELDDAARRVAEIVTTRVPGKKAHIVGHSLGGAVGLTLARLHPELVDHLMVSGTAAGLSRTLGNISLASAWLYRFIKPESLTQSAIRQFRIPDAYRDLVYDDLLATSTEAFTRHFTQALMNMALPDKFDGPALIAVGERETVPAKQAAQKLSSTLPQARGVVIPGVGHVWNLEAPDLFSQVVRAWVTGAPLPAQVRPLA